mmetsp:Transcript_1193/g.2402  ORF Transcript_1193/g.2402 Transcript_1193/m.2402 type:complete len:162 (+) Transcript_1193:689-1174(+)
MPLSVSLPSLQSSTVHPIVGDFSDERTQREIRKIVAAHRGQEGAADIILSDMASNFTGDKMTDALRTLSLCEEAMAFSVGRNNCFGLTADGDEGRPMLERGGVFVCKYFMCGRENEEEIRDASASYFGNVRVGVKPPSSRKDSAERYLLAMDFRGEGSTIV